MFLFSFLSLLIIPSLYVYYGSFELEIGNDVVLYVYECTDRIYERVSLYAKIPSGKFTSQLTL